MSPAFYTVRVGADDIVSEEQVRVFSFYLFIVRPKKLIICFSGTAHLTFNPPASKIFIAFPYSH